MNQHITVQWCRLGPPGWLGRSSQGLKPDQFWFWLHADPDLISHFKASQAPPCPVLGALSRCQRRRVLDAMSGNWKHQDNYRKLSYSPLANCAGQV